MVTDDELNANYIIPSVFHADVHTAVATAVRTAAEAARRAPPRRMPDHGAARLRVGDLLVATPALLDPNFAHTVVLVLDLDENGALGVVLNRPSTVRSATCCPDWADVVRTARRAVPGRPGQHRLRARGRRLDDLRRRPERRAGRLPAAVRRRRASSTSTRRPRSSRRR